MIPEEKAGIQAQFLALIKQKLQPNISFVDEISDLLHVSRDSAYRRIRGETTLTFEEIQTLSNHFQVSVDSLLNTGQGRVTFNNRAINEDTFTFEEYLKSILENLITINQFQVKELFFAAKDIPIFHYFQFRKLASFKIFFWLRTILAYQDYKDKHFTFETVDAKLLDLANEIWEKYIITPSVEIWSDETINITLRQVEFYFEAGVIRKDDALAVCREMETLLDHIKTQAAAGKKFFYEKRESGVDGSYQLYQNEVAIADNTIFFIMDEVKITFITHNNLNILSTTDGEFCEHTHYHLQNIIKKSTLLSSTSEKERGRFFKKMGDKLEKLIRRIEVQE